MQSSTSPAVKTAGAAPQDVVSAAALAGWSGVVLPLTEFSGVSVYPVVAPNSEVWTSREGQGPQLDRSTLAIWEGWRDDMGDCPPPATPLSITGFVSTSRFAGALRALTAISGFGPGLLLARGKRAPKTWRLFEVDVNGVGLAWAGPAETVLLSPPAKYSGSRIVATRYWEESLFDKALASGSLTRCVRPR